MNYPLKILSVAVEVFPFAKTGGFFNVAGSLPPDLKKILYDVRVLLPKYACTKSDDSIQSFDGKSGTSFKFAPNDRKSFQQALQNYLICFTDKPRWERLIKNDMDMDCNWDNSAQQYFRLFEDIQLNH